MRSEINQTSLPPKRGAVGFYLYKNYRKIDTNLDWQNTEQQLCRDTGRSRKNYTRTWRSLIALLTPMVAMVLQGWKQLSKPITSHTSNACFEHHLDLKTVIFQKWNEKENHTCVHQCETQLWHAHMFKSRAWHMYQEIPPSHSAICRCVLYGIPGRHTHTSLKTHLFVRLTQFETWRSNTEGLSSYPSLYHLNYGY